MNNLMDFSLEIQYSDLCYQEDEYNPKLSFFSIEGMNKKEM